MKLAALLLLVACHDQSAPVLPDSTAIPPPGIDAPTMPPMPRDCNLDSFDRGVGCACDASVSVWCDGGNSWCENGICRAFCDPVNYPRCPAGQVEQHQQHNGADQCLCVPS